MSTEIEIFTNDRTVHSGFSLKVQATLRISGEEFQKRIFICQHVTLPWKSQTLRFLRVRLLLLERSPLSGRNKFPLVEHLAPRYGFLLPSYSYFRFAPRSAELRLPLAEPGFAISINHRRVPSYAPLWHRGVVTNDGCLATREPFLLLILDFPLVFQPNFHFFPFFFLLSRVR